MRVESRQSVIVAAETETPRSAGSFRDVLRNRPAPSPALTSTRAEALLGEALARVTGQPPDKKTTQILTAHWALETDGGRCMPGHNFAGIKATGSASGAAYRTREGYGAHERQIVARFRSYDSAQAGAHDYVQLLASRYPAALAAARRGSSDDFSHELARGGYFTADPHLYAQGLAQRLSALEHGSEAGSQSALAQPGPGSSAVQGLLRALQREPSEAEEA